MSARFGCVIALAGAVAGCGSSTKTDAQLQAEIVANLHQSVLGKLQTLNQAAHDLQDAVPTPAGRGWDASADAVALSKMKTAWGTMRAAWEGTEGVVSAFTDLDAALDTRYEQSLAALGAAGDPDPFDGQGVIGMHAVERILFAPDIPQPVIDMESMLPGYAPASWPATTQAATELKTGLCGRLVSDAQTLIDRWGSPAVIDLPGAFEGLESLMSAQEEKVTLASEHLEESRYAQRTMGDLRDNLSGTRDIYDLFVPWLMTKPDGPPSDDRVQMAFLRLEQTYATVVGDAIPQPPSDWTVPPSAANQQTPFGQLFGAVRQEVNPTVAGSAVDEMNRVARELGLPEFTAN